VVAVSRLRRVLEWILGSALILLGIVGLFVPVLQGILFILAGLAVLSRHSRLAHRLYEGIKRRAKVAADRLRHR
jgi:uncharacterized protein